MRGGDKIYVVASLLLKPEHYFGKLIRSNCSAVSGVAYIVVLAKHAHEIAATEKYSAGSVTAHKGPFLAKVRAIAGHNGVTPGKAKSSFISSPVHSTHARAKRTPVKPPPGLINAPF